MRDVRMGGVVSGSAADGVAAWMRRRCRAMWCATLGVLDGGVGGRMSEDEDNHNRAFKRLSVWLLAQDAAFTQRTVWTALHLDGHEASLSQVKSWSSGIDNRKYRPMTPADLERVLRGLRRYYEEGGQAALAARLSGWLRLMLSEGVGALLVALETELGGSDF